MSFASAAMVLLAPGLTASAKAPWYERPSCAQAVQSVMELKVEDSEAQIEKLERSRDPDDIACSVYARVNLAEMYLTLYGDTPKWVQYRLDQLQRMYGFSRAFGKYGRRFKDMEIEARMRRIRALFEKGEKTSAISEARTTDRMLDRRRQGPVSPTVDFVTGVLYTTLGDAPFYQRALLQMAGIGGDADIGHAALNRLAHGDTVYAIEATYISHHFATTAHKEGERSDFGKPWDTGRRLTQLAENPQYAVEYTRALRKVKRCADALPVLQPHLDVLAQDRSHWSSEMRAKLYFEASRCAVETGALDLADEMRNRLVAQNRPKFQKDLDQLSAKIEAARQAASVTPASRAVGDEG
ncbi:MAG: hypothetical protein AAF851_19980 [Myxococcota bacterium]